MCNFVIRMFYDDDMLRYTVSLCIAKCRTPINLKFTLFLPGVLLTLGHILTRKTFRRSDISNISLLVIVTENFLLTNNEQANSLYIYIRR